MVTLKTNSWQINVLTNVQFVPNLAHNLLSVGQIMSSGYRVEFADGDCTIKDNQFNTLLANDFVSAHVVQGEEEMSKL